MAQEQNYQVNYTINVDATAGTKQVMAFADSVSKLTQAKTSLTPAVENIRKMMTDIDKAFRTNSGKKRDYSFKMDIDTKGTEEKLTRVKTMLGEIREMSKGINLVMNAGQALNSKTIKNQSKALINKKTLENQKAETEKTAAASIWEIGKYRKACLSKNWTPATGIFILSTSPIGNTREKYFHPWNEGEKKNLNYYLTNKNR